MTTGEIIFVLWSLAPATILFVDWWWRWAFALDHENWKAKTFGQRLYRTQWKLLSFGFSDLVIMCLLSIMVAVATGFVVMAVAFVVLPAIWANPTLRLTLIIPAIPLLAAGIRFGRKGLRQRDKFATKLKDGSAGT